MDINREPEQVRELALKINNAVAKLTNIDSILEETNADKKTAGKLKEEAVKVK